MYTYVCVYAHTWINVGRFPEQGCAIYIYIYIYTYIYACIQRCIYTDLYIQIYMHKYLCAYARTWLDVGLFAEQG